MVKMVKVAIPTDDGIRVSRHFGRAKYLLIAEPDSNWRKLTLLEQKGQRLARILRDEGVEEIVCRNIGSGMLEWLKRFGIRVVYTDNENIDDILKAENN